MTELLSGFIDLFQYLTVPGFLYLLGFLIIIQAETKIEFLTIILKYKHYSLPISILIVVISFTLGFVFFFALLELMNFFPGMFPNYTVKGLESDQVLSAAEKIEHAKRIAVVGNIYGILIMLRHLILSTIFVVLTLSYYYWKKDKNCENRRLFSIIYFFLMVPLSLAYLQYKTKLGDATNGKHIKSIWVILIMVVISFSSYFIFININRKKNNRSNFKDFIRRIAHPLLKSWIKISAHRKPLV